MGAGVFHGRVRDGIGCVNAAMGTRPPNRPLGRDVVQVAEGWLDGVWCGAGLGAACVVSWCGRRCGVWSEPIGRLGSLG